MVTHPLMLEYAPLSIWHIVRHEDKTLSNSCFITWACIFLFFRSFSDRAQKCLPHNQKNNLVSLIIQDVTEVFVWRELFSRLYLCCLVTVRILLAGKVHLCASLLLSLLASDVLFLNRVKAQEADFRDHFSEGPVNRILFESHLPSDGSGAVSTSH